VLVAAHRHVGMGNLPCNARVSVDPPCPSNASLSFEYTELVESKLLLQLACHSNTRSSSTNNDDRIVCVCIVLVAVHATDGFRYHLRAGVDGLSLIDSEFETLRPDCAVQVVARENEVIRSESMPSYSCEFYGAAAEFRRAWNTKVLDFPVDH
jgi:hypothetical protein